MDQIDSVISSAGGGDATLENSFLAADAKAENEEEVMYFLIGAIVATVVLVRSYFHFLVHTYT